MFRNSNPLITDENREPPQSLPYNSSRDVSNMKLRAPESNNKGKREEENHRSTTNRTHTPYEVTDISHRQNINSEDEDMIKLKFGENMESDNQSCN
jgi:hypothetical protein